MADPDIDRRVRFAAFAYLSELEERLGHHALPYAALRDFTFQGKRIPLIDRQRGIRNPKDLVATLSFKTTAGEEANRREYADGIAEDGFLRYSWQTGRGADTTNAAVRQAAAQGLPLIWFSGTASGVYEAIRPVYVVGDDPRTRQFVGAFGDLHRASWPVHTAEDAEVSRRYVDRTVRQRLHQAAFRSRVIAAYRETCAVCRLGCAALLDAAHIVPDRADGRAAVSNGMALCSLHHTAFDRNILGIDDQFRVHVRADFVSPGDAMAQTMVGEMQGREILRPRQRTLWPDPDLLRVRFAEFQAG